jgi:hypothetical protein
MNLLRPTRFAVVIVITGGVIGGLYFWKQLPPTISPQTEYAGIRLGMGPDEVLYINGSPPAVYGEAEKEGKWRGFQPINAPDAIGSW